MAEQTETTIDNKALGNFLAGAASVLFVVAVISIFLPARSPVDGVLERLDGIFLVNKAFARGFLAACDHPCVIKSNSGGRLGDYQALAEEIVSTGRIVVIDGRCASACAMMADLARQNVWINTRARFYFHQSDAEMPPPASTGVAAWVRSHGGYPTFASGKTTEMDFDAARAFWKPFFDWYRLPKRIDAPWHWPNDPIGIRELTYGLPTFVMPSPQSSRLTAISELRGTVQ